MDPREKLQKQKLVQNSPLLGKTIHQMIYDPDLQTEA